MLPTTRLALAHKRRSGAASMMGGPPDPNRPDAPPRGVLRRAATEAKSGLRMVFLLAEEWYRQLAIEYYQWRGCVVLVDRHFVFDYYYHDVVSRRRYRSLSSRLHGFHLRRLYPRPDLVICLDAPAAVLHARKGEGTVAAIEQRRQEYLQLRSLVPHFVVVDATQPEEVVAAEVVGIVRDFYWLRRGERPEARHA
jgi:thymidylate kinase